MSSAMEIKSQLGDYVVRFEENLETTISNLSKIEHSVLIVDKLVAKLYPRLKESSLFACWIEIEASEENKTLKKCEDILRFFSENGANKGTHIVAIGGGIIQDLVTFCTHVYFRGLEWTYVPTTLLGMADSCIGGKASINFLGYKNQLGVFHSPREVWVCSEFLSTLPASEIASGYGEIVKLHLIKGPGVWKGLLAALASEGLQHRKHGAAIRASLEIKKAVIEVDEFDHDLRKTLNYGHTFGHALESITSHQVPHGIAVAWGMDLINFIAFRTELISEAQFLEIHTFLENVFLWEISTFVDVDELLAATRKDKKSVNGSLMLILPTTQGTVKIVPQAYTDDLREIISDYLKNFNIMKQAPTTS